MRTYDIEEYDTAVATYMDGRRRFQDSKLSRGYLPVVALQDSPSSIFFLFTSYNKGNERNLRWHLHCGALGNCPQPPSAKPTASTASGGPSKTGHYS